MDNKLKGIFDSKSIEINQEMTQIKDMLGKFNKLYLLGNH